MWDSLDSHKVALRSTPGGSLDEKCGGTHLVLFEDT